MNRRELIVNAAKAAASITAASVVPLPKMPLDVLPIDVWIRAMEMYNGYGWISRKNHGRYAGHRSE